MSTAAQRERDSLDAADATLAHRDATFAAGLPEAWRDPSHDDGWSSDQPDPVPGGLWLCRRGRSGPCGQVTCRGVYRLSERWREGLSCERCDLPPRTGDYPPPGWEDPR